MTAPDHLRSAVDDLSREAGVRFAISERAVHGTSLFVVYALEHPLPDKYVAQTATLGFRVPTTLPDAHPEDCFFLQGADLRLRAVDPVRNSSEIHRASFNADFLKGTELEGQSALVFSWHLWDRSPWNRRKHTLRDQYHHVIRRFDQPEHD